MKLRRLWYIVCIGGAVVAASQTGCKQERIEQHRVAKMPATETAAAEPIDAQTTNTGKLPAGHPDVSGMTAEQMQQMAQQMPGMLPQTSGAAQGPDVTFTLPAGWTEKQPPGPMLLHEFVAGNARATVSMLGGNGGGMLANINRWRGQLGLGPTDEQGVMSMVKPVSVDGVDGWRVDLTGQGDGAKETIGVIVERDGAAWFFKLNGANDAVTAQADAFDALVKSVKWKS